MVKVIIADDHPVVRELIANRINRTEGMQVIASARNGQEAVRLVSELQPDILLMDIGMPIMGGIEALKEIHRSRSATRVIMLTGYTDRTFLNESMIAGARGFLSKDIDLRRLIEAIKAVMKDNTAVFSRSVKQYLPNQDGVLLFI